jgi:fibro-slime domain-containing protein
MIHSMLGRVASVVGERAVPTYRYSVLATCVWALATTGCGSERVAIGSFETSALASRTDAGQADSGNLLGTDDAGTPEFYMLPPGFTPATKGGYKLGDPFTSSMLPASADAGTSNRCTGTILGVVRDFKRGDWPDGHPDFETFAGDGETGIVEPTLGADSKPIYVDGVHKFTTTKANFDQWYRNVPGVNEPYLLYLVVEPNDGVFTFDSQSFFPLDDMGFGNQDLEHNFSFTTEVHTTFLYNGGESFRFTGDDDLWVFINGHLGIDLGGLHPSKSDTITLDFEAATLGLEKGNLYSLDLFHAERHSHASNFRIDTNIKFVNCAIIVDVK